jgi:hypothetical protein
MKKGLDGAWNTVEAGKCCPYWYAQKPSHSMQARSRLGRNAILRTVAPDQRERVAVDVNADTAVIRRPTLSTFCG